MRAMRCATLSLLSVMSGCAVSPQTPRTPEARTSLQQGPDVCAGGVQVRMNLLQDNSSLRERKVGESLRITPDKGIFDRIAEHRGTFADNPKLHTAVKRWLSARCSRINAAERPACQRFFKQEDPELTALLDDEHRRLLRALLPTEQERESEAWRRSDESVFRQWWVNYVGHWTPVLRITVDNSGGHRNVQIIAFIYDVTRTFIPRGDLPGSPELRFRRYTFDLAFETGKQRVELNGQRPGELSVPPGEASTFEVELRPASDAPRPASWSGEMIVETNQGPCSAGRLDMIAYRSRGG